MFLDAAYLWSLLSRGRPPSVPMTARPLLLTAAGLAAGGAGPFAGRTYVSLDGELVLVEALHLDVVLDVLHPHDVVDDVLDATLDVAVIDVAREHHLAVLDVDVDVARI